MNSRPIAKTFREQVEGDIKEYESQKKLSESKPKENKHSNSVSEKSAFDRAKDSAKEGLNAAKHAFQHYTHTDQTDNRREIIEALQQELSKKAQSDDELYKKYNELFCSMKYGMRKISRLATTMSKTLLLVSRACRT